MSPTPPSSAMPHASAPASGWVYKICTPAQRSVLRENGLWEGSLDDVRDGFVHLSTAAQVPGTLTKHFAGQGALWLVVVDPGLLPAGVLRWERSRGGALFPHLYGALSMGVVVGEHQLMAEDGQTPSPPAGLGEGAPEAAVRMV